jgi:hypothetical protein
LKKTILYFILLFSTSIYADAHVYFGTGVARVTEKLSSSEKSITNTQKVIKIGYGDRESYAVELALNYTSNHSEYFAPNDAYKYGFSIDLMKAYELGIFINPYIKLGFGSGALKTNADTNNNSLTYGTFNSALGFFIPFSSQFDAEIAYQYKYVSYEKIDLTSSDNPTSHINLIYAGINIRF